MPTSALLKNSSMNHSRGPPPPQVYTAFIGVEFVRKGVVAREGRRLPIKKKTLAMATALKRVKVGL